MNIPCVYDIAFCLEKVFFYHMYYECSLFILRQRYAVVIEIPAQVATWRRPTIDTTHGKNYETYIKCDIEGNNTPSVSDILFW